MSQRMEIMLTNPVRTRFLSLVTRLQTVSQRCHNDTTLSDNVTLTCDSVT